jgi:uncharacterized protein YbjQ (UPF0145 family)
MYLSTKLKPSENSDIEERRVLGIVRGNSVKAKNTGRDYTQKVRSIFGGELKQYTDLLQKTREEAIENMKEDARSLNADGILDVTFETSKASAKGTEVNVVGTAVELEGDYIE